MRQKKAYPVYDDEYKMHIDTIREDIAAHYPTLHLVGRKYFSSAARSCSPEARAPALLIAS